MKNLMKKMNLIILRRNNLAKANTGIDINYPPAKAEGNSIIGDNSH